MLSLILDIAHNAILSSVRSKRSRLGLSVCSDY